MRAAIAAALLLSALACATTAEARIHIAFGSRSELMVDVGTGGTPDAGPFGKDHWAMIKLGAGYRFGHNLSVGLNGAADYFGRAAVSYQPVGSDFLGSTETLVITPVTATAKLRIPVGRRGEPFVGAGVGGYTFWMLPDQRGAPRHTETRPGFHVEAGVAVLMRPCSPRLELRYDARSTGKDEIGLLPRGWFRMLSLSVGVQLP